MAIVTPPPCCLTSTQMNRFQSVFYHIYENISLRPAGARRTVRRREKEDLMYVPA